jgi:malate permease and related proteins
MKLLADIILLVTLPILALIAVGYGVQSKVPEARKVLSYVYSNVVLPCFMIHFLSTSRLPLSEMLPVVWFTVLQSALLGATGWWVARGLGLNRDASLVVGIGGVFGNTGNFGVPLAILAFPSENTVHQAIIAATTAIVFVPVCTLLFSPADSERRFLGALRMVALNPIVLGVGGGLILRGLALELPVFLSKPVQFLAGAYTGVALMGLGAALHGGRIDLGNLPLRLTLTMKLLVTPIATWILAYALGFSGHVLSLFVVAGSMPTAALVGVLAAQHQKDSRAAVSAVFISTLLAPVVVTAWIFITRALNI